MDVRFFLYKGTYEERTLLHTVMRRDRWFQILMGQQRRALGRLEPNDRDEDAGDAGLLAVTKAEAGAQAGSLTEGEKSAVMLDLPPEVRQECSGTSAPTRPGRQHARAQKPPSLGAAGVS